MSPLTSEPVDRPWGSWHVLDTNGDLKYQIKRIHVTPGRRLSLQSHEHRAEHWVVLQGEATCEVDGETTRLTAGGSIDVPLGARHRLGNNGNIELIIIEVQRGTYVGEDDIRRYEDDFGR